MTLGRKFPFQVYSLTVKVSTVDLGNLELEAILRKITILAQTYCGKISNTGRPQKRFNVAACPSQFIKIRGRITENSPSCVGRANS